MLKVLCVCGARPNFMKVAPLLEAFRQTGAIESRLVHTGQHYDAAMSALFFDELGIPRPDVNLEVGSASHAVQTAEVMKRFEPILISERPDWVVVVGDVNSTLACALVAAKLGVRVAHVEAGLRSFDRSMPEEINRVVTDAVSDLLLASEPSGVENLRREGIDERRIHFVGNVMIDTLLRHRRRAESSAILERLSLTTRSFVVVTLHRPSNVDQADSLRRITAELARIGRDMPVVFPTHPRTRAKLGEFGLLGVPGVQAIEPLGYLDFLKLMSHAAVVLTDSGGVQEESTILNVPCLTLRANTERPITITCGTNRLVEPAGICVAWSRACKEPPRARKPPPLWDGRAADRVAACLLDANIELQTVRKTGEHEAKVIDTPPG